MMIMAKFLSKLINEINAKAGTNISVYHNFHNEVALCRKLLYRCNGICQIQSPNYGLLHSFPDEMLTWYINHVVNCGGELNRVLHYDKRVSDTEDQEISDDASNILPNGVSVIINDENEMFVDATDECQKTDENMTKVKKLSDFKKQLVDSGQLFRQINYFDADMGKTVNKVQRNHL